MQLSSISCDKLLRKITANARHIIDWTHLDIVIVLLEISLLFSEKLLWERS